MFCHYRHADGMTKPPGQGHAPTPPRANKNPRCGPGVRIRVLFLGERQAAGVMPDPVGGRVRVKGVDAEPFETVP